MSDPAGVDRGGGLSRWLGQTVSDGRPSSSNSTSAAEAMGWLLNGCRDRPAGRRMVPINALLT